jgi:mono/diheme cytochrome c family protein
MDRAVASSSNAGARERGATVFETRGCERCHAILGVGGDRAPDLATVGERRSASQIKTQVMNGGHGMPPFGSILSKDEVKDVVTFLSSCRTKDAPGCRQWMPAETAQ